MYIYICIISFFSRVTWHIVHVWGETGRHVHAMQSLNVYPAQSHLTGCDASSSKNDLQ